MLESPPSSADTTSPAPGGGGMRRVLTWLRNWPYTFIIVFSLASAATAIIVAARLDRPITDPEGFLGPAYIRLPLIGLGMLAADVLPRAFARAYRAVKASRDYTGVTGHLAAAFWSCARVLPDARHVLREHWSWKRVGYAAAGMVSFYTCYVAYRNLKSFLPLITDRNYDSQLDQMDAWLSFGSRPSLLLHDILGTDIAAHILAFWYISYLPLNVLVLGAFVAWSKDLGRGAWAATALSLNWMIGVASYYALPTLGPGIAYPSYIWELEDNSASTLQHSLTMNRNEFVSDLNDPSLSQGVAGFASLHVSVVFTVALILHQSGMAKWICNIAWVYLIGTILATLYFGWHYILDDIGGAAIAYLAVWIGAKVTRQPSRRERLRARAEAEAATDDPARE